MGTIILSVITRCPQLLRNPAVEYNVGADGGCGSGKFGGARSGAGGDAASQELVASLVQDHLR